VTFSTAIDYVQYYLIPPRCLQKEISVLGHLGQIRSHLEVYKDLFVDCTDEVSGTIIKPELIHGFSASVIEEVILKCHLLCSGDDVMQHVMGLVISASQGSV
jgi:hypothetical protein